MTTYALYVVFTFVVLILISAIIGVCFIVWCHALLFGYVDLHILGAGTAASSPAEFSYLSPSTWGLPPSVILERITARGGWELSFAIALQYLLWPVQFGFVRDLIGLGAVFGLFNVIPVYVIWWERKVAGRIQSRTGPMRVGGWHGWAQSFADGIKLLLKEDLVPGGADAPLFRIAPYFAVIPSAINPENYTTWVPSLSASRLADTETSSDEPSRHRTASSIPRRVAPPESAPAIDSRSSWERRKTASGRSTSSSRVQPESSSIAGLA